MRIAGRRGGLLLGRHGGRAKHLLGRAAGAADRIAGANLLHPFQPERHALLAKLSVFVAEAVDRRDAIVAIPEIAEPALQIPSERHVVLITAVRWVPAGRQPNAPVTGAPRLGLQLLGVKVAVVDRVVYPGARARVDLRPNAAKLLRQDFLNAPRQGLIDRARLRVATLLRQVEDRFVARLFEGRTRRVLVARHVEELPAEPTGDATLKAALRRDEEIRFCVRHRFPFQTSALPSALRFSERSAGIHASTLHQLSGSASPLV